MRVKCRCATKWDGAASARYRSSHQPTICLLATNPTIIRDEPFFSVDGKHCCLRLCRSVKASGEFVSNPVIPISRISCRFPLYFAEIGKCFLCPWRKAYPRQHYADRRCDPVTTTEERSTVLFQKQKPPFGGFCFFLAGAEGLEPSARGFGAAPECPKTVEK